MKQVKKQKNVGKLIFYICGLALPILQFVIFYVIVNFDTILLAFQNYDRVSNSYFFSLSNFPQVWKDVFGKNPEYSLKDAFLNSFKYYFVSLVFCTGLGLLFSNYIYKKCFGNKFFQIILFLPKILSVVVLSVVFIYALNDGVPAIVEKVLNKDIRGLFTNNDTKFNYILAFTIWSSFGTGVLMYTSTMTGISQEIVESAQLDGITPLKEFIYITLPMIYPTLSTFLVVNFAAIFTDQMNIYTFYQYNAPQEHWTVGYYIYQRAQLASAYNDYQQYAYLSAFGLILSAIAIPTTLLFKRILEKVGPSAD